MNRLFDPILRTTFSALAGVPAHTRVLSARGDLRYVQTHYLRQAVPALACQGPVRLVTHGSDATADDQLAAAVPSNARAWFSMNSATDRARPLPIGLRSDSPDCPLLRTMREATPRPAEERSLVYYCATWQTPNLPECARVEREAIYEILHSRTWATTEGGASIGDVPFERFIDHLASHKFVVCPRGAGFDTHRLWEALYMGAVPILRYSRVSHRFTNAAIDIPALYVYDWSQLTPDLLEHAYPTLKARVDAFIEPLTASYWLKGIFDA